MIRPASKIALTIFWACSCAVASRAADPATSDQRTAEFFESKIRPVLAARCFECHGGGAKSEGNLRLDSRAALLRGGDRGPAVKPGEPKESLLVSAINHGDVVQMPPKTKLPAHEIIDLTAWVAQGAPWPDAPATSQPQTAAGRQFEITSADREFWAFKPPREPVVPPVKATRWLKNRLDPFVLAPLEVRGLEPAAPADKRTLIRRATFDLNGVPPTPEEIESFLADKSVDAFAKVVDRLLASPRYGERWARHWLDIARYADSNGMDENMAMANAWRYRDWVVAALNNDKPYDQFIREQLAGDLLPPADDATNFERLIATGFLVLGPKMLAEDDPVKMEMDIIDEQVDTVGRAFLGLTLGCARCHDHKFDPIPTADYYSLAGIFKSTKSMENYRVVAMWSERPLATSDEVARLDDHRRQIARASDALKPAQRAASDALIGEARGRLAHYLLAATRRQQNARALAELTAGKPFGGALVIEAENFARGNMVRDFTTYGQGIGVIYNAGPLPNFAEYDVELPAVGTYQIALRYAAAESRPVGLSIDGRQLGSDAAGKATGSWQMDTQTWSIEAAIPLAAGKHMIRIERNGPVPHIDKLALLPARFVRDSANGAWKISGQGDEGDLKPVLIGQWSDYLARTANDPNSVLRIWHTWREADGFGTAPQFDETTSAAIALLKAPRPSSLAELAARYAQLCREAETAAKPLDPTQEAFRQILVDPAGPFAIPKNIEAEYPPATQAKLTKLKEELAALERSAPKLPAALAVSEREPQNLHVHVRGNHLTQGALAPRGFPRILAGDDVRPIGDKSSGRLELAEWLARSDNPLTARVMVNRIWQGHFGEGLVRSPDNFGRLGERPDNQPLLDWLARRFVDSGWSIKTMHRTIMQSSAYQMSTTYSQHPADVDPENRLLWRMSRRRLEAEEIRDAILAASTRLDGSMGGTLLASANHTYVTSTASRNDVNYDNARRSIYLPVIRSAVYDVFQAFDFADPSTMNGKRPSTTVAPQALFMMNSALVLAQTRAMAQRLLSDAQIDDAGRVTQAYVRAYGRPPDGMEISKALEFVSRYQSDLANKNIESSDSRTRSWQALCRVIFSSNEFIFLE
jgi:cytochrome c553